MSNAREVIRITKGRGIIFSSGPGGPDAMRGPLDIVNLCVFHEYFRAPLTNPSATVLGMPANLAKDAVSLTPKSVLLNARKSPVSTDLN
jgi:ribonuclease P/MRP protein subunit RPP1